MKTKNSLFKLNQLFLICTLLWVTTPLAFAAPHLSWVGLETFAKPITRDSSLKFTGKWSPGGGVLVALPLNHRIRLEVGGLYMTRKYDFTATGVTQTLEIPAVQVPLTLKYSLCKWLALSAGGYAAVGTHSIQSTSGSTSQHLSFGNAGLKVQDYGLLGGLRLSFALSHTSAFILDGRYLRSLTNISTVSGRTIKNQDVQVLAGFTLALNGR